MLIYLLPNYGTIDNETMKQEIIRYLSWLAKSSYCYHIDDDPMDIIELPQEAREVLKHNSDIVWRYDDIDPSFNPWEYFEPKTLSEIANALYQDQ